MSARTEPLQGMRRHKLVTAEIRRSLPPLYSQDGKGADTLFRLKLFCPYNARHTLFVAEFDGEDTLYGFCVSPHGIDSDEWGYSSLRELAETTYAPFGGRVKIPAIERDCHFEPTQAKDLLEWHQWNDRLDAAARDEVPS